MLGRIRWEALTQEELQMACDVLADGFAKCLKGNGSDEPWPDSLVYEAFCRGRMIAHKKGWLAADEDTTFDGLG